MRLGDTSRQLMVLASFSCNTLQTSDGNSAVLVTVAPVGELKMRRGIVEPAMQQILCRVDQREFGLVGVESARERLQDRLDGA